MRAMVVRPSAYGEPEQAYREETVQVPALGPHDVLLRVMAAGVNFNGVWVALGHPLDVCALRGEPFHIGGSDGSGVVAAVGSAVRRLRVGDEVVIDANVWDPNCSYVQAGRPLESPTTQVLGYEVNYGTFAEYSRVREHQCHPKPPGLDWAESASLLASAGSARHMLTRFPPHVVDEGDVVLVWGGAGGLGSMAIQLAVNAGARPVAVVSSAERGAYCLELGAVGAIDRTDFDHWGPMPDPDHTEAMAAWTHSVRRFGRAIWQVIGEQVSPRIVVEHPGAATLPTSLYVAARHGMVVTCGATSGYGGTLDLRHLWMRRKRLQGSHMYDPEDVEAVLELVNAGKLRPPGTEVWPLERAGEAHQMLRDNHMPPGKLVLRVGY